MEKQRYSTKEEYEEAMRKLDEQIRWYADEACGNNNHWNDKSSPEGEEYWELRNKVRDLEGQYDVLLEEYTRIFPPKTEETK